MTDSNTQAAQNALSMFDQCYDSTTHSFDHKRLLDELVRRNDGKPLPKRSQVTLACMVKFYMLRRDAQTGRARSAPGN